MTEGRRLVSPFSPYGIFCGLLNINFLDRKRASSLFCVCQSILYLFRWCQSGLFWWNARLEGAGFELFVLEEWLTKEVYVCRFISRAGNGMDLFQKWMPNFKMSSVTTRIRMPESNREAINYRNQNEKRNRRIISRHHSFSEFFFFPFYQKVRHFLFQIGKWNSLRERRDMWGWMIKRPSICKVVIAFQFFIPHGIPSDWQVNRKCLCVKKN